MNKWITSASRNFHKWLAYKTLANIQHCAYLNIDAKFNVGCQLSKNEFWGMEILCALHPEIVIS